MTEAAVHTRTAPTRLEALPVFVLEVISATVSTAQVKQMVVPALRLRQSSTHHSYRSPRISDFFDLDSMC